MKYLIVTFALCMSISLVSGQFFGSHYSSFGGRRNFGLHAVAPDYNSPATYAGSIQQSVRDSRQDRGPVVFPPSPPDAPEESSGVIIGASGYGFVPPNQPQFRSESFPAQSSFDFPSFGSISHIRPSINRFNSRHLQRFPFF